MSYSSRCFLVVYLFFICSEQASESVVQSATVMINGSIQYNEIERLLSSAACVEHVDYQSDVYFQKEEFFYLLGFNQGDIVGAPDVIQAVEYFVKKNKFSKIKCDVASSGQGIHMQFYFESMWTCNRVKIKGVFYGKNSLLKHYIIEPGSQFDHHQHEHSLVNIQKSLMQDGYYRASVSSFLEYNVTTKEVTIYIKINKGKRFCYDNIVVDFAFSGSSYIQERELLQLYLQDRLSHSLTLKYAKRNLLDHEILSLKRYLSQKGFLHVTIALEEKINAQQGTVDLLLRVVSKEKKRFVFLGNSFFSDKQLHAIIVEFGRSACLMPSSVLAQEIARVYKAKGFWDVEVVTQEEKENYFFVIKEGRRASIKRVELCGVEKMDYGYLIKRCFGKLLRRRLYDEDLYDEAINLLYASYAKKGFLAFDVVDRQFIREKDEYTLVVKVDEQQSISIGSVIVEGYPELSSEGPLKLFSESGRVSAPMDTYYIQEQREWLLSYFQSRGFLHPQCKPIVDVSNGVAAITWKVKEGDQVRFGKTVVTGSVTFPFKLFLSSLCYQQGQLWNQERMRQTFMRMKELEVFDSLHLAPDYSRKGEEKTIVAKIREDDNYEVRVRSGLELQHVRKYQTFNGVTYKVGGTALVKNPFNCGDQFRFDCDLARSHKEIIGQYRRPFFLRVPLISLFQAYFISYKQPGFIESVNDIYTLNQRGVFAGFQRKAQKTDIGFKAGFEWMSTNIKDGLLSVEIAQAIDFDPRLIDQFVPFFFVEPGIVFTHLDNPFNPSHGTLTIISLKAMVPMKDRFSNTGFFKALGEQSFFFPIRMSVLALRVRLGHIFRREIRSIMPSERFFLGGSHSLRGYEIDLAPPLSTFTNEDGDVRIVPRGGRSVFNINCEIRVPLVRGIGGVVFQDAGALSGDKFLGFNRTNMLAATGFGFRFFTPLGPLRFDIGWRWRKQLQLERSFAWFLTLGHAF